MTEPPAGEGPVVPGPPPVPAAAAIEQAYDALRQGTGAGVGAVAGRDVVVVEGPDAVAFLQGQLSQDVAGLAVGASAPALVLEPAGKVVAWLRVTRTADERLVLDLDAGWGPSVLTRLERFKLRTKATLDLQSGWVARALSRANRPDEHRPPTDERPTAAEQASLVVAAPWPGASGTDRLERADGAPVEGTPGGWWALEALRIECGVPRLGAELEPGRTIPAEGGRWLIDASVSFSKGCYTGQELVARVDSRGGQGPRPVRLLVLEGDGPDDLPPLGSPVASDAGAAPAGHLSSVAWSPRRGVVALAVVARSVEPSSAVFVRTPAGVVTGRLEALPG